MTTPRRIAYYLWRYPLLSETFIQREVAALQSVADLSLHIIADAPEGKTDHSSIQYLFPLQAGRFVRYLGRAVVRQPAALARLFGHLLTHRYQHSRNPIRSMLVFFKIVYLAEWLRETRIAHLHSPWADVNAYIAMLAARLADIPYSVQARAHDLHRTTSAYALREKFAAARFIVTNTRYNLIHVQALVYEAEWGKIHQIYNGIPLDQFTCSAGRSTSAEPFHILTVGRLIEQKGFVDLLKACAILRDRGLASFRCEIVGAPELPLYAGYYQSLMQHHRRLKLEGLVTFSGAQSQDYVRAALRRSDCFVLPSVLAKDGSRDVIPNAILEAMAMELPVLSTPVTGIPEMIEDGVDGFLVPPGDPQALANRLADMMKKPALRARLGANARKTVETRFDIEKNIQRYVALFLDGPQPSTTDVTLEADVLQG